MPTTTLPKIPNISAGPSMHVYDVIVVGGQLAGALAAAMLAKHGYRVLLIEHDGMGPGYEHEGFLLPYAPFILPGLKAMPAVEEAFTELGLTTPFQRSAQPHEPGLQLALPRSRVDLRPELPRTVAELRREFGPEGETLGSAIGALTAWHEQSDAFFKAPVELPADGLMEGWRLKTWIRQHPGLEAALPALGAEGAGALLSRLLPFLTYLDAPTQTLARGRALSQALAFMGRYPGGREGLRELLTRRMLDLGGAMLGRESTEGFVVESLAFEGNKLVGVKLLRSDSIYRAAGVVAATDSGALRRLLEDKKRHRKVTEMLDLSSTRQFLFSINWVLKADALPRGMGELVLAETDAELGPMLVQVLPARRVDKGEDGELRVVCAGVFVPANVRELGETHLEALARRLGGHLDALLPFAREQLLLSSAPYLDAGGVRGSRLLPHPLFSVDMEQRLGVEGLKQRTPVRNLFLANREVLPGLGLEGEFLAGLRAVRLVEETLPKRDLLKR